MNICFVYKYYPCQANFNDSGLGNYIYNLAHSLSCKQSVYVLAQSEIKSVFKQHHLTIQTYPKINLPTLINKRVLVVLVRNIYVAWYLIKMNLRYHFDVIEFANWEAEGLLFSIICLIFRLPVKLICRLHTGTLDCDLHNNAASLSTKIINYFEIIFVKLPNIILTTSTYAHAWHSKDIYHINNKKIAIIPLGISLPQSRNIKKVTPEFRVVFIGRIEGRKGIDPLIKCAPYVLEKYPHHHLLAIKNLLCKCLLNKTL